MAINSAFELEASTTELRTELGKERLLVAELSHKLRELERTHKHEMNELKNLLAAEQQKSSKWKSMIAERNATNLTELEQQLSETAAREQRLLSEYESLKKYYDKEAIDKRLRDLETQNYALKEKVKGLEREKQTARDDILADLLEKEQKILDLTETVDQLSGMLEEADQNSFMRRTDKAVRLETKDLRIKIEDLEETVSTLKTEKWQLVQELEECKHRQFEELERLSEQAKHEVAHIAEKCQRLKAELAESTEEMNFNMEKWNEERNKNSELIEDLHFAEDKIQQLEEDHRKLMSGLKSRERKIEKLENEISKEDEGDQLAGEKLKELQRTNSSLLQQLRDREAASRVIETERNTLLQQLAALQREVKRIQSEKKDLQDLMENKDIEMEGLQDQLKMRDDKISKIKEDMQKEMAQRVMELKQEKLALEDKLEEMEENMERTRVFTENSDQDELAQLDDDFKPFGMTPKSELRHFNFDENRLSMSRPMGQTPKSELRFNFDDARMPKPLASPKFFGLISPRNFADPKLTDKLKLELSEKEYIVKTLRGDNDALEEKLKELQDENFDLKEQLAKFDIERTSTENYYKAMLKDSTVMLTLKIDRLETANMEFSSEIDKLKVKLMKSSETWAEENNTLRAALNEAETLAYKCKHQYIEAATDRDIFMKRYNELAREKSLMGKIGSLFKRKT